MSMENHLAHLSRPHTVISRCAITSICVSANEVRRTLWMVASVAWSRLAVDSSMIKNEDERSLSSPRASASSCLWPWPAR